MPKSKVAVLKVKPQTILEDIERLCDLAGMKQALDPKATTLLKDNISWHFPFPGANTTRWQLEGTARALRHSGFSDVVCVQNKTVVMNALKGEDMKRYIQIFESEKRRVIYIFGVQDMKWMRL